MAPANPIILRGTEPAPFTSGPNYGFPTQYSSQIKNLMCNQQGDNVFISPVGANDTVSSPPLNAGDTLIAIAIGLKSYNPFDLLHGDSPQPGFLQGLNDFNANPSITDGSGGVAVVVTGVAIAKTSYVVTAAANTNGTTTVYTGTFSGSANDVGLYFTVSGFTGAAIANNGTYLCTAQNGGTTLTLLNNEGVLATQAATAVSYVLTVTAANSFVGYSAGTQPTGDEVKLSGLAEPWLNGETFRVVVSPSGTSFTANYPSWTADYTNAAEPGTALATPEGINEWVLVKNLNLVDSDYTVISTPPPAGSPYPASSWNLDGFYPSIYIWVAKNAVAGNYNVNLNSMYNDGIDYPQDLAAGKPIFDGGVDFQVFVVANADLTTPVDDSSIGLSSAAIAVSAAPLTTSASNGDLLLAIGLQKSGNVFSTGTVQPASTSPVIAEGAAMSMAACGKLVGSEAHWMVEYALTAPGSAGSFDPYFNNPLEYEMVVATIAIKAA
jgi:hypothetical protein